jgi:hypothetical protein
MGLSEAFGWPDALEAGDCVLVRLLEPKWWPSVAFSEDQLFSQGVGFLCDCLLLHAQAIPGVYSIEYSDRLFKLYAVASLYLGFKIR